MQSPVSRVFLAAGLSLALAACGAGAKNFKQGEKLQAAGNLLGARAEYKEALAREPANKKYEAALNKLDERVDLEMERIAGEAKAKEKAGDWAGASATWARAQELKPKDKDLEARKQLSMLKSKNLDPDGWYQGVDALAKALPDNPIVQKTLAGARAAAYSYHLKLANGLVEAGEGAKAWKAYERAKAIEPSMPGLDASLYATAEALDLAEQGDLRLAAGDTIGAHELYEKSLAKKNLPEVAKKREKAKGQASAILGKITQARQKAEKGRWKEALALYDSLAGAAGVPPSVDQEASHARAEVSKSGAEEASKLAERGDLKRAGSTLADALKYSELDKATQDAVLAAVEQAVSGQPGKSVKTLEGSGAPDTAPVVTAARAIAGMAAKVAVLKAKSLAGRDPTSALAALADLDPFASQIPEIEELRRSMVKGAFQGMLDEALRAAKAGDDVKAADLLLGALNASKAPPAMRGPAEEACQQLRDRHFADAERSFGRALAEAPASKLAQRGADIARLRRKSAEAGAIEIVRSGSGDVEGAVATLAAALAAEPGHPGAKTASELLANRAKSQASTADDLKLAGLLGQAARLSELPADARSAIEQANAALAEGNHGDAEKQFSRASEAAPKSLVATIGRDLARSRVIAALKADSKQLKGGDEAAALAVAKLLKADPSNAEAKQALDGLLGKASAAAKAGNDAEAARYLKLVNIATQPPPGVLTALEKAIGSLANGQPGEAEKAFGEALDLDADHPGAKLGLEITRKARTAGLKSAIAEAKSGAGFEKAQAALRRTLELDPDGAEAKQAYAELLAEAEVRGNKGADREAAALLDTANVVSRPEAARRSIEDANKLLADGKHRDAEAAYDKILSGAQSQVAAVGKKIARERTVQVLLAGVAELAKAGDLERGARATQELIKLDATRPEAKEAIESAMGHATKALGAGDEKRAGEIMRAIGTAVNAGKEFTAAIELLEQKKYDESEGAFAKLGGDIAGRAAQVVRDRKLASLKAGISGDDEKAAQSIRALLKADPSNKEALKAFAALLDRARAAGRKNDDAQAAALLSQALVASAAPEDLDAMVKVGITHLADGRFGEAERGFLTALEVAKDSKVARAGQEIARARRQTAEKAALAALSKNDDPMPHAKVLKGSLLVEPGSKAAASGFAALSARARKAATKGDDAELARCLDALGQLEGLGGQMESAVTAAAGKIASGAHEEAEKAFAAVNEGGEGPEPERKSKAAQLGVELVRVRRVSQLQGELQAAQKSNDVMAQSALVSKILAIDPNDKTAKALQKKVGAGVVDQRVELAMAQKGYGNMGAAAVYLRRALAMDPENKRAKQELEAIEKELKSRLDLIVIVDKVAKAPSLSAAACPLIEDKLREAVMAAGSSKNDLGYYVLSKDWTEAVEKKEKDAPKPSGVLTIKVAQCTLTPASGKLTAIWALMTPTAEGKAIAKGSMDAELPKGIIPVDEQDSGASHARDALAERAARALIEKVTNERDAVALWLMTLAEHAMEQKDAAVAADAFERLLIKRPRQFDPKRAEPVEQWLAQELK